MVNQNSYPSRGHVWFHIIVLLDGKATYLCGGVGGLLLSKIFKFLDRDIFLGLYVPEAVILFSVAI